jgi:hypothetical protein
MIAKFIAVLVMLPMLGGAAIAGAATDRQLAREGRERDRETARAAERMQRDGERANEWDRRFRSLQRSCRCR